MQPFDLSSRNNFPVFILKTAFILSLVLFGISCSQKPEEPKITELPSDQTITQSVITQLNNRTDVPADSIEVDTQKGVVTLNGSTTNLMAKQRATKIAQSIHGVLSVVNNLIVSTSRPDDAVDQDIDQALKTDPATENWEINADVNNGLVTLTGAVDSWQEKKLAENVTSGVKGVKAINNNIIIADDEDRTAAAIKAEVKSTLMYDSRIRDNMIKVAATDSSVTLSGAVGSATEKRLAIQKAHVKGVETVTAENLEVHPEYNSKMFLNKEINSLNSSQIKKAIERAFTYDPRVPATAISVDVTDSVATLSGTVKNLNSKLAAATDAQNTTGIETVKNNIDVIREVVVEPEIPTTDEAIKSRIKNSIRRDPYIEETNLTINVDDGIVEVIGDVNSKFEKRQVEEIIQDVKGVISIDNQLKIKPESGSTM